MEAIKHNHPADRPGFIHYQHAHCESGVTANLLRHYGIPLSEPMAFGIGAGIFFAHVPFIKVSGTPATTFRTWPGAVFKRVTQRLNITVHTEKFRDASRSMQALDRALENGIPVGMQTSVFYLPYLPEAFRFHFNAHNIVVYGKDQAGRYFVSDPILEQSAVIEAEDLARARFAKGVPEPRGFMYYVIDAPADVDYLPAIRKGIAQTCYFMLSPPLPWFGNNGISLLARKVRRYPEKLSPRKTALYLGNIIRMQEEIGTGGGGFRYLYAAFLQEAGKLTGKEEFSGFSEELTQIGDQWRNIAYHAARIVKERTTDLVSCNEISDLFLAVGAAEKGFFTRLKAFNKQKN